MYGFKMSKKKTVEAVAYDAYDIWAAAVYANRANNGYNKEDLWSMDPDTHLVEETHIHWQTEQLHVRHWQKLLA